MESILGIEIAENALKVLELRKSDTGWELLHPANIELPAGIVKEGIISDPKSIADKLSAYLKEKNITTKKAVALVNSPFVLCRLIRLPYEFTDSQITMNLEAEINQYKVFSGKEVIIDFRKIEEINEEGVKKINVLFAATYKELAETYLKVAALADLDLVGIDVPVFSIMRLLDEVDLHSGSLDAVLLILIERKHIEICVVKGNRPRFLHSLEIDEYDFQNQKEDFVERIVSAIKLVLNFYQARFIQGEEISRILVSPLEAKFSEITGLLRGKMPQLSIEISQPLNKIHINKDALGGEMGLGYAFAGILGASLRLEKKELPFNLNFLREQRAKIKRRYNELSLLLISLTSVFSLMLFSFTWMVVKINILQIKLSQISLKLQQPTPELSKSISIKEQKDILDKQIQEATRIIGDLGKPLYFANIAKAMVLAPPGLWLTDVSLEKSGKSLVVNGQSKAEKAVFDYKSILGNCGYFTTVELVSSQPGAEGIKFTIRCAIK